MGLGIGQTTVVAPTYLAEMAPKAIRGLCTCMFAGSVYLGIMLGYFASYGTNLHISNTSATQWIIPNSLHLIFAGSIFLMTFLAIESPRWLVKVGQDEKASAALCKLRKQSIEDTYLQAELIDITSSVEQERSSHANSNVLTLFVELWTSKANLYRMFLGCFAQLLGQWSGANCEYSIHQFTYIANVSYQPSRSTHRNTSQSLALQGPRKACLQQPSSALSSSYPPFFARSSLWTSLAASVRCAPASPFSSSRFSTLRSSCGSTLALPKGSSSRRRRSTLLRARLR